ncbi:MULTISPECIES: HNH endonuclease family protein [Rhodococcus]|uniref:HNH endonuclease family protein n=1 Tax=Rhodococcus TaxID=1827 RepID=UPI0013B35CE1|nr:HNH endonuclease family protein [Rhodococcus sp. AQ5-07]
MVLEGVEHHLRTEYNEDVSIGHTLQIEHVMPQKWHTHWDTGLDEGVAADRDRLVNTLGNLTLVTQKLNGSLSHRPWTDEEAAVSAPTGKEAGRGKRSLLSKFSVLRVNTQIIDEYGNRWTDQDIRSRSMELTKRICQVWVRPDKAWPTGLSVHVDSSPTA